MPEKEELGPMVHTELITLTFIPSSEQVGQSHLPSQDGWWDGWEAKWEAPKSKLAHSGDGGQEGRMRVAEGFSVLLLGCLESPHWSLKD